MRIALALLLVASTACAGGGNSNVANAVIMSAIALGSAGISRANGGCYSSCPTGTACNENTGLCEYLPCRDRCTASEECDEVTQTCVVRAAPIDLSVGQERDPTVYDYDRGSRPETVPHTPR